MSPVPSPVSRSSRFAGSRVGVALVLVAALGVGAYALWGRPGVVAAPRASAPLPPQGATTEVHGVAARGSVEAAAPGVTSGAVGRATVGGVGAQDEASLMAELRRLGDTAPERSIELARAGNEAYPDGEHAPERARIVVKSLVNLKRFHEARDAARAMVAEYPGDPWTLEVERHLLVNPLDYPSREELQAAGAPR